MRAVNDEGLPKNYKKKRKNVCIFHLDVIIHNFSLWLNVIAIFSVCVCVCCK